ncbi:uncharacterized protein LOC9640762 isoform X1 [Selaginella moellendorffii]|uniref:uncharacterized protein LOC9640762 isoform X1 n=1 Tax=Selaginella moellendorffii TaxID=88036 RepID=UPI000D1C469B|nr:uncharacterized protein LOC9640762 isoform X1 [Selaginella moellendorffii]XP_024515489.1 uncharacterized protein LOC9640762 isoform X1 [Selaginella moellendorffii]|eukprot:XP_024515488.1 uncharacterized protein LOC9640762 isoform X1 [Selaginella moellendorffii]
MAMAISRCCCSYKKATVIVCIFNVAAAFYVLDVLLSSSSRSSSGIPWRRRHVLGFSAQEALRIQEAHEIRRKVEPHELIDRVKEIQLESDQESSGPGAIRRKAAMDIVQRLRDIQSTNNQTASQALSEWRRKRLEAARAREAKQPAETNATSDMNQELAQEEVSKLVELGWLHTHTEPPSLPVSDSDTGEILPTVTGAEVEDGIIPGRIVPPECHAEAHTDYDGVAVRWGLTHHTESAADCCQACFNQAKAAKPGEMKCNVWVFCAAENGCYSPDIYEHKHQECWLKQADEPKLNFKGHYHEEYRQTHQNAPVVVPWVSGVIRE